MKEKIMQHIAVEQFYQDSDGYWVVLKDGYEWFGCVSIHEYTLKAVWNSLKDINHL